MTVEAIKRYELSEKTSCVERDKHLPPRSLISITPTQIWNEAIQFYHSQEQYILRLATPWTTFSGCTKEDIKHEALIAAYNAIVDTARKGQWTKFIGYFYTHFRKGLHKISGGVPTVSYSEADPSGSSVKAQQERTPEDLILMEEIFNHIKKKKKEALKWALKQMNSKQQETWICTIETNLKGRLRTKTEIAQWLGIEHREVGLLKSRGLDIVKSSIPPMRIRNFVKEYLSDEKVTCLI